jgi:hypothetical protein
VYSITNLKLLKVRDGLFFLVWWLVILAITKRGFPDNTWTFSTMKNGYPKAAVRNVNLLSQLAS